MRHGEDALDLVDDLKHDLARESRDGHAPNGGRTIEARKSQAENSLLGDAVGRSIYRTKKGSAKTRSPILVPVHSVG